MRNTDTIKNTTQKTREMRNTDTTKNTTQKTKEMRRKPEIPEKTIDQSQVTDNRYHIMLYRVHLTINTVIKKSNLTNIKYCDDIFFFRFRLEVH